MLRAAIVAALLLALAPPAQAFRIGSGFSPPCHERIIAQAWLDFILELDTSNVKTPPDGLWTEFAEWLLSELPPKWQQLEGAQRFMLVSLIIGIRAPDTHGHSILDLNNMREFHSDPTPEGQYAHALRAPGDDGPDGEAAAVAGTRIHIAKVMNQAHAILQEEPKQQIGLGPIYLDFYGRVDVEVWEPLFRLGLAAHAVQDSFSHMIRSEADGFRTIVHVTNFVEAVSGELVETRDGLAHSDSLDDCLGDTGPTVAAAIEATTDLFEAAHARYTGAEPDAIELVLDKWFVFQPGCDHDNGFCGNEHWVDVARQAQTGPMLGCHGASHVPLAVTLAALLGLGLLCRRRAR